MKSILLGVALLTVFNCYSQNKNAIQNLKQDAVIMGASFVNGDFKTFAKYTYPVILKSIGGEAKMSAILTKTINDIKAQGMNLGNITFDEPSKIVKSGKELQATIAQHTEMKLSQGRMVSTSTLVAISTDNGNNWTFIDTSNKDVVKLRKALSNLSSAIIIPPQQQPIRYNF